jgi:ribosomal protein S18 acetylase RimI-like enzyme
MNNVKTKTVFRPFTLDDAKATVNLFNAYAQHLFGYDDCELDEMITDWTSPGIELEEVVRVVEDEHGQIIGYFDVWDITEPHVTKYTWGILHPNAWDPMLYQNMLAWAESCSRKRIALAPENARVVMSQGIPHKDKRRQDALANYGYKLVRHFFRMEIELTTAPEKPFIPEGLQIVPIDIDSEFEAAIFATEEAFEDHWGHVKKPMDELLKQWQHYIQNSDNFDPTMWFLAKDGDQIAGICRSRGKMAEDPHLGWVNQLAVRKPWRRRGLGMALLLTAFNDFHQRGYKRVGLGVDATNITNATRLYEKAGMHVTQQYDTYEKELRLGHDLATRG